MKFDYQKLMQEVDRMVTRKWNNRTLDQLGELVPEEQDENVLFRHNWLAKGQAFALVASSGVGKSSMADQLAYHWALGDAFLAEPTRPLSIAVIQHEDSDRDLQEQRDGMKRGLLSEGWSMAKVERALAAVVFPTDFIGLEGDQFLNLLTEYQADCRKHLLLINPLQRVFGGELSSQKDTSHFCAGIDKILKHPEYGCGAGIIMHTPKFHSGIKDGRQSVDDYAEYAMAGSQEWTAWVRAIINFQKHGTSEDYFDIKASKRGKRLCWKDANGNPTTKRIFKHSDGFIYWQEVTDADEIAAIPSELQAMGRKREEKPGMDIKAAACFWAKEIADHEELQRMGTNELRDAIYAAMKQNGRTRLDARNVFDELSSNPADYGLKIRRDQFGRKTFEVEVKNEDK